jgi:hypothetical protein
VKETIHPKRIGGLRPTCGDVSDPQFRIANDPSGIETQCRSNERHLGLLYPESPVLDFVVPFGAKQKRQRSLRETDTQFFALILGELGDSTIASELSYCVMSASLPM